MTAPENLFTFLSIGEAIRRTFSIYSSRWQLFSQLALVLVVPQIILSIILRKTLLTESNDSMDPDHLRVYGIGFAFAYSFGTLIQAAVVQVVAEYYTQTSSTFQDSLAVAFDQFLGLFGYSLLYAAALIILSVMTLCLFFMILVQNRGLQVFGTVLTAASMALSVYVMCSLTLALPVLVIEKQSPIPAITRAFELFPTYRSFVFCVIFPLAVIFIPHFLMMMTSFSDSAVVTVCRSLPALFTLPLQAM
jgi:hypothetical protein